jgi:outer membrane protein OmpA-like peptidoglycan-associated protein
MRSVRFGLGFVVAAMLAAAVPLPVTSQGIGGALRKKAEEAKKKLETDKKTAADTAKPKAATDSAKSTATPGAAGAPKAADASGAPQAKADPKIWDNYDFVPGSKVMFYTDFSEDKVGNFARRLKYVNGPAEVVERDDVKMLRSTGRANFLIPLGRKLPEKFTLEIDVISPTVYMGGYDLVAVEGGPAMDRSDKSAEVNWQVNGMVIIGGGQNIGMSQTQFPDAATAQNTGKVVHLRYLMDGAYFKMYSSERRVYNIPELQFKRDTVIRVLIRGGEEANQALFITSVRVAESETDVLYDALANKGRWATQGILFATGKADVQPESRPVLKEIASTLKQHGDLKILIEGHTDNVGSATSNLALSDARAAAVKAVLVADYGVDGSRVTTKGFGDTKPSVPNTTAEGRSQNRRVEIVKQ